MITKETDTYLHYTATFAGQSVDVVRNKATDQTYFSVESVATALGYASAAEMMADPFAVAMITEQNQQTPHCQVCRVDPTTGNPVWP